jgi:hypothetical protein
MSYSLTVLATSPWSPTAYRSMWARFAMFALPFLRPVQEQPFLPAL